MIAVEIKNISKKFKVYHNRETHLKYAILNILKGKKARLSSAFWALKNINIQIEKGKTVGFIGRNGSGKSTLLKLMSQILYPDGGTIETHGKISTLIELGAGFHPELTGRENVYINASILGLSRREVNRKFNEIVHFSGLASFIDNPVKTYSSGMYVRLGFSVAINIDPDILLVDEVLAVGDESFQKKCIKKIHELKKAEKTIVFVSHDLESIEELCDEVYLLQNGQLVKKGKPIDAISEYHRLLMGGSDQHLNEGKAMVQDTPMVSNGKNRWGSKEVEITSVVFLDKNGKETDFITTGDPFRARINYEAHSKIEQPVFGIAIYSDIGIHITGPNTKKEGFTIDSVEGKGYIQYEVGSLPLMPGTYLFSAAIYDFSGMHPYDHWEQYWKFHVLESKTVTHRYGLISMPSKWRGDTLHR